MLKLCVNKSAKIKAQMSEMVSLNNTIMSLVPLTKRKCDSQRNFASAHKNTKTSLSMHFHNATLCFLKIMLLKIVRFYFLFSFSLYIGNCRHLVYTIKG